MTSRDYESIQTRNGLTSGPTAFTSTLHSLSYTPNIPELAKVNLGLTIRKKNLSAQPVAKIGQFPD